jgi:transposase
MTTKHYCGLDFHKKFTQICVLDSEGKTVEDAKYFDDANKVSSYLGLVPREFSSGDKVRFSGITKSGSEITRSNRNNKDNTRRWAARLKDKSVMNKAVLAVAHKTAKVMFAVMRDGTVYRQKKAA